MWEFPFNNLDPAGSAGAALLCGVLSERLSSRQAELCSETLCWVFLPVVFRLAGRSTGDSGLKATLPSNSRSHAPSPVSLWIVAIGIVMHSVFKAENGMVAFLPALAPILLVAQRYLGSEGSSSANTDSSLFSLLVNTVWGTALTALLSFATLTAGDIGEYALSAIPTVALLMVYVVLTPKTRKAPRWLPSFEVEKEVLPLSLRVLVLLCIALSVETYLFEFPRGGLLSALTLGLSKALTWYFLVHTARSSSWRTAAATGIFSLLSTCNPFALSSDVQAVSYVVASFLTLGQVIHLLPHQANKSILWAFLLLSLIPFVANTLTIRSARSAIIPSHAHPIETLVQKANTEFQDLIDRQSKTSRAAHTEYRRRYGVDPPPGFDAWYEFAQSHQSPIIDDFDTLYARVSPFWRLTGLEVQEAMRSVESASSNELWLCTFSNREAKTRCRNSHRANDRHIAFSFDKLLAVLPGVLPDITFLVNHLDEPRVLLPPGQKTRSNMENLSRRPVWETLTKYCSQKISGGHEYTVGTYGLPFVTNISSAMDLCHHPEYSSMHGFAISPTSFRLIEGTVPILSTGSPSTMGDILFPSPAYLESEFEYVDAHDIDWDKKQNNLYWAGSTTGGFALDDQWHHFHRQRFVHLTQNLGQQQHHYIRNEDGVIRRIQSSFLNSRLYNVAFSRILHCERKHCRDERVHFHFKSWADRNRPLQSRLVFDLDGNGISGRYYKLLASKSLPLKQTLFKEWHDDRLIPWVHYIPVSQSLAELPEMVLYLTSTESGQKRAKEIAEHGREWFSKAFREVDRTVYVYRLILELARLQDPERPALL